MIFFSMHLQSLYNAPRITDIQYMYMDYGPSFNLLIFNLYKNLASFNFRTWNNRLSRAVGL